MNDEFKLKVNDARSSSSGLNNVCDEDLTESEEKLFLDIFRSLDHRRAYSFKILDLKFIKLVSIKVLSKI